MRVFHPVLGFTLNEVIHIVYILSYDIEKVMILKVDSHLDQVFSPKQT